MSKHDMFQIDDIADQVLTNCNIADSQHAGLYSICGLALRLRDLYKWENRLDPWIENDPSEVLKWIGDKEDAWEELAEKEFKDIRLVGRRFDPFDVKGINEILEPYGFIYGGGYARSLKPSFFLAALENKKEINHIAVFILDREFARDLLTIPALSQDNCIYIRKESARLFLWDQIFYVKKSGRYALKFGLEDYGLKDETPEDLHRNLPIIAANETDTYIYHELGEIRDAIFDRKTWQEIIASFPHTPIELLTRTVKDLLADTGRYGT
ncbi:MAG: Sfum_1244 family protein, partial [Desulfobacterales bacterium]